MASKTFQDYLLASLTVAYDKLRLPERLYKSVVDSVMSISAREWLKFNGQEVRQLPAGITMNAQGELVLDPAAVTTVEILLPKVTLAQEAELKEYLLAGTGVTVSIIKEYPATNGDPATTRDFLPSQVPLTTNNFQVRLTFQPGATFRQLVVLYEINV